MASRLTFYIGNDNTFFWQDMALATDGTFVSTATITATLYDASAAAVSGSTGISLTLLSGSDRTYYGVSPATSLPVGTTSSSGYELKITATYSGRTGYFEIPVDVVERVS